VSAQAQSRTAQSRAIAIVTPAPRGSQTGNRATALRWALLLRRSGEAPFVATRWTGRPARALLAVHAVKTADSVAAFAAQRPDCPIAVVLAGTDIYPAAGADPALQRTLAAARILVALQPDALLELPAALRLKARVILQSATATPRPRCRDAFQVCVLAHLREVKDPLLPLRALAWVPAGANVRVLLAGGALDPALGRAAEAASDPRFRWLGELRRTAARRLLAESHVCIVPSRSEGGANVISEAVAAGTPVLASAIPGNLGLLGGDWPGQFAAGDERALAALLTRAAGEPPFYTLLRQRTRQLAPQFEPAREQRALAGLLRDLGAG
jgi:putative glycosyltransferase (TIGR04348 family)